MNFFDDILKRKAPLAAVPAAPAPQTAPERDELLGLQVEIDCHREQLAGLEKELSHAASQLSEVAGLAAALKIAISEGSPSASISLDALESRQRSIERTREGLALRLRSLEAVIAPKNARAIELAKRRDAERRRLELCEVRETCDALMEEMLSTWRAACAKAFQLTQTLDDANARGGSTSGTAEEQRQQREDFRQQLRTLSSELARRSFQAGLEAGTPQWLVLRRDLTHALSVKPAMPRADIARAG